MSGRRSEPAPIPPVRRMVNGVLHVGSDPWFDCGFCGTKFDTAECGTCPTCAEASAESWRRHRDDVRVWAAETLMPFTTTIQ